VQKDTNYKVLLNVCYITLQIDYKEEGKVKTLVTPSIAQF